MRTPPNQNRSQDPVQATAHGRQANADDLTQPAESSTSFVGRRRLLSELSASWGVRSDADRSGRRGEEPLALELGRLVGASTEFSDESGW